PLSARASRRRLVQTHSPRAEPRRRRAGPHPERAAPDARPWRAPVPDRGTRSRVFESRQQFRVAHQGALHALEDLLGLGQGVHVVLHCLKHNCVLRSMPSLRDLLEPSIRLWGEPNRHRHVWNSTTLIPGMARGYVAAPDLAGSRRRHPSHTMNTAPVSSPENAEPVPGSVIPGAVTRNVAIAVMRWAGSSSAPVMEVMRAPSTASPATAMMMIDGDAATSAVATVAPRPCST